MMHRPHSNPSWITSLLASAGIVAMLLASTACKHEKAAPVAPSQPPVVSVMETFPRDVPVAFEYIAQTQSSHRVNIQARVSGFLDRRLYTQGALVKAGQVLFQMDAKPFQVQLSQAEAALAK